jgi:hypothetical protein
MISRLMLNLHSTTSAGIFSTFPTSEAFTEVALTTGMPDPCVINDDTEFQLGVKIPIRNIHARGGAHFSGGGDQGS